MSKNLIYHGGLALSTLLSVSCLISCTYAGSSSFMAIAIERDYPLMNNVSFMGNAGENTLGIRAIFSHEGGSQDIAPSDWTIIDPKPWTVQFVDRNSDGSFSQASSVPSWVHIKNANGSDLSSLPGIGSDFKVCVDSSASVKGNPHNAALRSAAPRGSDDSPWNLSSASGSLSSASDVQNTANCYIINAPGTYCLPIVYGNAIKNGQANANAYRSSVAVYSTDVYDDDKNYVLSTFKNHLDADITDPWIDNNANCVSADAALVWQDEQDLVLVGADLKMVDGKKFLVFTVPAASIKQGNALIAVRDAQGTIMWSWHIWVTDYVPGLPSDTDDPMRDKVVQNHSEQHDRYTMMPLNLGWTDNFTESYLGRVAYIQFTQAETGEVVILKVKQRAYTDASWSNTYYQWGRKDPMLGLTIDPDSPNSWQNGVNKTTYTADPKLDFKITTGDKTIGEAISAPNVFFVRSTNDKGNCNYDWCSIHYSNLWDADFVINREATEYDNLKTVYDPSPVGYKVPPYSAFDGLSYGGGYASDYDNCGFYSGKINTTYTQGEEFEANRGFEIFCNLMAGKCQWDDRSGTVFYPASGYRDFDSGMGYFLGSTGFFWVAAAYDYDSSNCLHFNSYRVSPHNDDDRPGGYSVRPVRE